MDTNIEKPIKGEHSDFSPVDQPDGTFRMGLNLVKSTKDGRGNSISNENANDICGNFPEGYIPIGKVYMNNGRNVVWLCNLDETSNEIGVVDKDCNYTTIVSGKLGFTLNHQISATYRLRRGCEDVVYFTDGNVSVKYFNLNRLQDFYSQKYKTWLANPVGSFTGQRWDVNKFNLFPAYTVPCFSGMEVLTGGQIKSGTINFAIQYVDSNLNPTNFIYSSQLVPIYASSLSSTYSSIVGSSNVDVDPLAGTPPTNKSVRLTLSSLDNTYTFYRIAVIEATDKTGNPTRVLLSPNIPINRTEFTYDGNTSGYTEITLADLALGKSDIDTAEHIEQQENKLILASTKGKQVNYCGFQRFASKIRTNYIIREASASDVLDVGNPKSPHTYWEREGYMGGEVYPLGIVYVFNNGLESPVGHIPGRPLNRYWNPINNTVVVTADDTVITPWNKDVAFINSNPTNYNALPTTSKAKKFQVYETAVKLNTANDSIGAMGYHQNTGVFYENRTDCNENDYWGLDGYGQVLTGKPIRHHKFPTRGIEPHVKNGSLATGKTGLYATVALLEGQTFETTDSYTLSVTYELNGSPQTKDYVIDDENFPFNAIKIDEGDGGYDIFEIIDVSGTATTETTKFTVTVEKQTINAGFTDTTIVRNLGIQFSNIQYPHPDIVGHYFVRGKRDDQNRTILDKGFAGQLKKVDIDGQRYNAFTYFNSFDDNEKETLSNYLFTPRVFFNKETLNGDYLRYEGEFPRTGVNVFSNEEDGAGSWTKEVNMKIEVRVHGYGGLNSVNSNQNYAVTKSIVLDGAAKDLTFNGPTSPLYNLSWTNRAHIVNTQSRLPISGKDHKDMYYVSYMVNRNVHPILDDIRYQRTHNCMYTLANTQRVFGGDTFISRWDISNSLYRKQKKGIFKSLLKLILVVGAAVATVITAGAGAPAIVAALGAVGVTASAIGVSAIIVATAILAGAIGVTSTAIEVLTNEINDGVLEQVTDDGEFNNASGNGIRFSSYVAYANEFMEGLYIESEVNVSLRQTEEHVCGEYFAYKTSIYDYFRSRWLMYNIDTNKYEPKGFACPETYNYNKDFSRENTQNIYESLPSTYDCCSNCKESHPNRVHWSEESFQEELTDNFRVFKVNNYRDIEAEHGNITAITKRNNNLFILTSEALWLLPQNQQERVTSELISFIGTGEYFSIKPKKIIDGDIGSAGTQHKWTVLNTDDGLIYVNQLQNKIYLFDRELQEISKVGIKYWFKNNLVDHFANQYRGITGKNFPNVDNHANPFGIGIHTTFDSFHNRLIVTKRDYLLLSDYILNFKIVSSVGGVMPDDLTPGQLVFDSTTNKFVVSRGIPTNFDYVDFSNQVYFEDKSWTRSFCLEEGEQAWMGLHSYIPNFYLYNHDDLYSFVARTNKVWKHNTPNKYQQFYGVAYPHIYEYVDQKNKAETVVTEDITFQTIASKLDSVSREEVELRDVTFNKMIAYNNRQSTGELLLSPKGEGDEDYMFEQTKDLVGIITVNRVERDWNLNDIRDNIIDPSKPLFLSNWGAIKTEFPIDKVPNQANINFLKDWLELESMRDKYLIIRLKFDNFTDVQLTTNYLLSTQQNSDR